MTDRPNAIWIGVYTPEMRWISFLHPPITSSLTTNMHLTRVKVYACARLYGCRLQLNRGATRGRSPRAPELDAKRFESGRNRGVVIWPRLPEGLSGETAGTTFGTLAAGAHPAQPPGPRATGGRRAGSNA